MRSKFSSVFALATAAAISFGASYGAFAATIGVTGVNGAWTTTDPTDPVGFSGRNTNTINWGTVHSSSTTGLQSGYSFAGTAAGQIETGKDFLLGTFTHNNFVIVQGTSIKRADLSIGINLMIGGVSKAVNAAFSFNHDETNNFGEGNGLCANGKANNVAGDVNQAGCADRVTISKNKALDQSFEIDGLLYILEITGFTISDKLFSEFWTVEDKKNEAVLKARFTQVGTVPPKGEPTPSPVPLPAAGWMLLAAVGVLSAARARRKS